MFVSGSFAGPRLTRNDQTDSLENKERGKGTDTHARSKTKTNNDRKRKVAKVDVEANEEERKCSLAEWGTRETKKKTDANFCPNKT